VYLDNACVNCDVAVTDLESQTGVNKVRCLLLKLSEDLKNMIESYSDNRILHVLLSLEGLSREEHAIIVGVTASYYARNDKLLLYITQCDEKSTILLYALLETDQRHVFNYVRQQGKLLFIIYTVSNCSPYPVLVKGGSRGRVRRVGHALVWTASLKRRLFGSHCRLRPIFPDYPELQCLNLSNQH